MSPPSPPESDRERALELLRANHRFPVDYHLSVITRHEETVFVAVRAVVEAGGPLEEDAYQRIASSGGRYASHRFRVRLQTAEAVLELYARVRAVEGVITVM